MYVTTKAQRASIKRLWLRIDESKRPTYRAFRRTVQGPFLHNDPCMMVQLWNMWIGIEADGYTHS